MCVGLLGRLLMQADLAEEGPFCLLPFFLPVSYSWYLEELDKSWEWSKDDRAEREEPGSEPLLLGLIASWLLFCEGLNLLWA